MRCCVADAADAQRSKFVAYWSPVFATVLLVGDVAGAWCVVVAAGSCIHHPKRASAQQQQQQQHEAASRHILQPQSEVPCGI
jgi:hypothetical protein